MPIKIRGLTLPSRVILQQNPSEVQVESKQEIVIPEIEPKQEIVIPEIEPKQEIVIPEPESIQDILYDSEPEVYAHPVKAKTSMSKRKTSLNPLSDE